MIHFKPFRFGRAEVTALAVFTVLLLLGIGVGTVPIIATWYGRLTTAWTKLALHYGYWGAFFSAVVGSVTIIIVFPYTIIIVFLASQGLNPIYLGLLMGLGATIGQMSGYLIGLTGSRYVARQKPTTYEALEEIVTRRPGMIQWLLFVFAVTPLPDDVVFIPLGILRYPWWKIILPTLLGKVISGLFVTSFGYFFRQAIDTTSAAPATAIISQFGTLAAIVLVVYFFIKLDWQKMMHRLLDRSSPPEPTHSTDIL